MIPDEELIQVTDASELRPGMTLVCKRCRLHSDLRRCVYIYFGITPDTYHHAHYDDPHDTCDNTPLHRTSHPGSGLPLWGGLCLQQCIAEGRLFRLRPEPILGKQVRMSVKVGDKTIVFGPMHSDYTYRRKR